MPDRQAVHRRRERVMAMLHELPAPAHRAIRESYGRTVELADVGARHRPGTDQDRPTDVYPRIDD